jgi:hypothetical protein
VDLQALEKVLVTFGALKEFEIVEATGEGVGSDDQVGLPCSI